MALADSLCQGTTGFRSAKIEWFRTHVAQWLNENVTAVASAREYGKLMVQKALELAS